MKKKYVIAAAAALTIAGAAYAGFKCTKCNGTGWDGSFKCFRCGGDGEVGN